MKKSHDEWREYFRTAQDVYMDLLGRPLFEGGDLEGVSFRALQFDALHFTRADLEASVRSSGEYRRKHPGEAAPTQDLPPLRVE